MFYSPNQPPNQPGYHNTARKRYILRELPPTRSGPQQYCKSKPKSHHATTHPTCFGVHRFHGFGLSSPITKCVNTLRASFS